MEIDFNTETTYGDDNDDDDDKYIKKKKTYKDSIITKFYNKKIPEERAPHKCLSIIF